MLVGFDFRARDFPDRGGIASFLPPFDLGLLALYPTEEARFVRPHVDGVRHHRPALHPDDLLMRECTDLVPDRLEHRLPSTGMPAVPGCVGSDRAFDRGHDESQ